MTEQLPPHDREAEQGVLGSILHDNEALARIGGLLLPADFFLPAHREIFAAMVDLRGRDKPIDEITLVDALRRGMKLDKVGGATYVSELRDLTPAASNALSYAQLVREKANLRKLIGAAHEVAQAGMEGRQDTYALIDGARKTFDAIAQQSAASAASARTSAELFTLLDARTSDTVDGAAATMPVLTYTAIDRKIGPLAVEYVTTVAADTGMGKSTFVFGVAGRNAWMGVPVACFSLEMNPINCVARLSCAWANIDSIKLLKERTRNFTKDEWDRYMEARATICALPLYWPRLKRGARMADIEAQAAYYVREKGVKLLVVDHLRLINAGGRNIPDNMAEASDRLATLAQHLEVAILSVAQINREGGKADKPSIHHIQGSSSIEQDSETIIIIHGPSPDSGGDRSKLEFIVGKARDGRAGSVWLPFEPEYNRFDHDYWLERTRERHQGVFGITE